MRKDNGEPSSSDKNGTCRFLRRQAVLELTGLTISTMYQMMAEGRFPRPVKLSARSVAWPEDEIVSWQQRKLLERAVSSR